MKSVVKVLLIAIPSLAAGFAGGYFFRKKACEVKVEEISPEEFDSLLNDDCKGSTKAEKDVQKEPAKESAVDASNVQKEPYFKKWMEYNTTTKESPEEKDIMALSEEDFQIDETSDDEAEKYNRPMVEAASIEEWRYHLNHENSEYDTAELEWYSTDDVVCDDQGEPITDAEAMLGFSVSEMFEKVPKELSQDPEVRIVANHRTEMLYYISRVEASYRWKRKREEYGSEAYDDDGDEIYRRFHG